MLRKRTLGVIGFLFFLLVVISNISLVPYAAASSDKAADKYIVVLQDNILSPSDVANEMATKHGLALGHIYQHALKGYSATIPEPALAKIKADPRIKYLEPDREVHALGQIIPTGINRIDADLSPTAKIDGTDERVNVDIAIIDTGICLNHPDLYVYKNVTFVKGTKTGNDDNGHGSHVAGIAAAKDNGIGVVGVAPGARLWAVKVLDKSGSGFLSWIIAGIDYVAKNAGEIEVANMSLGGVGYSQAERDAIVRCIEKGVVFVVAAGNEYKDVYGDDGLFGTADDLTPAAYPEVATVSALADSDGRGGGEGAATIWGPDDTLATFSNFSRSVVANNPVESAGAAIDFAAPGVNIYSTYKNNGYATGSGTSMAAPHGAGSIALYIARYGRAVDAQGVWAIRQALIDSAEPQTLWGPADTKDPDANREGLISAKDL